MNFFDIIIFVISFLTNLPDTINTVNQLDVPSYMGNWHQVYTNRVTSLVFGENSSCITTNYRLIEDEEFNNKIDMNFKLKNNESYINHSGIGYTLNNSHPGELVAHFYNDNVAFKYLIIENGPLVDNQYQYSIVTDDLGIMLFVFIRNLNDFLLYQKDIDVVLENYNFTDYFRQPLIVDNTNC